MTLKILDKIITLNGIYEVRSIEPLKCYNTHNGNLEYIEYGTYAPINDKDYKILKSLEYDKLLKKIKDEYPEIQI